MEHIRDNYHRLVDLVAECAERSGRSPAAVRLVGVTKGVKPEIIRTAVEEGLREVGENRVQEAEEKIDNLRDLAVTFHLIGRLQSNKAVRALKLFSVVQTVDSCKLATRLDKLAVEPVKVLVQVKLDPEGTKGGVVVDELPKLIDTVRSLKRLRLRGLMTVPPFMEDPDRVRPYFSRLRTLAEAYRLDELSMGMSHDFRVAIEEGATMIRIGRGLFGERQ